MAIQGIITGYACPSDHSAFLCLVGRGSGYVLVDTGSSVPVGDDLDAAFGLFHDRMAAHGDAACEWVHVTEMVVANVGASRVAKVDARYTYESARPERYAQEALSDAMRMGG